MKDDDDDDDLMYTLQFTYSSSYNLLPLLSSAKLLTVFAGNGNSPILENDVVICKCDISSSLLRSVPDGYPSIPNSSDHSQI